MRTIQTSIKGFFLQDRKTGFFYNKGLLDNPELTDQMDTACIVYCWHPQWNSGYKKISVKITYLMKYDRYEDLQSFTL